MRLVKETKVGNEDAMPEIESYMSTSPRRKGNMSRRHGGSELMITFVISITSPRTVIQDLNSGGCDLLLDGE